jgi:DNA polymerase III subunit beta
MQFQMNKDKLLYHLVISQKALSNKTPNPALTGIKVDVFKDRLLLTTSNGEISILKTITDPSLQVEEEGTVLIPGRYFVEIIRKLDGQNVLLSSHEDNLLKIEADHSDITLNLLDVEDYPKLLFKESAESVKVNVRVFKTLIRQTAFAASSVENRPILTGVYLKLDGNLLTGVATDSYRLAKKSIELDQIYAPTDVIIPSKAVEELGRILEDNQKNVELHFSPSSILFKYDGTLLLSRLLEGNYPETSKLIPLDFPNEVVFNKEQLLIAIERASLLSIRDGQNAIVKLEIKEDDTVEISSSSPEIGRVLEEIQPVAEVKGNPLKIAFSSKFLLDALKAFNSSEIKVGFTGEIRPFVMTGEYDPDMLQLILPVKTD